MLVENCPHLVRVEIISERGILYLLMDLAGVSQQRLHLAALFRQDRFDLALLLIGQVQVVTLP